MPSKQRFALIAVLQLLLFIVIGAPAQTFRSAPVQTVIGTPRVMASGDFNRDGKPDLVYQDASNGGSLHVLFGKGDGTFLEAQELSLPLNVGSRITVADLNNDGFLDLIIGYDGFGSNFTPPEFSALLNRGDGTFAAPIFSSFPSLASPDTAANHIAVADFDADGHTDFVFAATAGLILMRGDGTGHFTAQVLAPPLAYGDMRDIFLADFNEDSKPDVAINGTFGVYYALNRGGDSFGPVTRIAQVLTNPPAGFGTADIDSDGHQDIVYGTGLLYAAFGKGDGTFATPRIIGSNATSPGYAYLAFQDVNGDGRPDLITTNSGSPIVQLQTASGQFPFTYGNVSAVGDIGFLAPVFADFDGDGIGDVVTGATGALVFSKGRADGTFNGARVILTAGNTLDIQPVDLNRDGIPDAVITVGGGSFYGDLYTFLGDGAGLFTAQALQPNVSNTFAGQSSVADFNLDGIPDIFNAGYTLDGDGTGNLGAGTLIAKPPAAYIPEGFTVTADFNEDGRPDAVTTTRPLTVGTACTLAVATSSGAGTWSTQQLTLPYLNTVNGGAPVCAGPLVTADFNGDGHKDLATASFGAIYTWLGDGKGNFTAGPILSIGYTASGYAGVQSGQNDMEAADLDGDGSIDLIVPIADKNILQIFYGRGDGTFEPPVSLPTAQDVRYVTVADMNQDGIPDMILGGHALVRILHGLGHRTFESTPGSYAANPYPQKIRVADVNKDGNPDLLVPNGGYSAILEPGQSFTVLLNAAPPRAANLLLPAMVCTPEPSSINQSFTCTATFTPAANAASPVGNVTFTFDGTSAGTAPLTARQAVVTFPATLSPGKHAITATFPGDANFLAANASTTHLVALAPASIVLVGPTHVAFGQPVPLQATLSGKEGAPTGTIAFTDAANVLAQTILKAGTAGASISTLAPGTHLLQASYSGDSTYAAGLSNTLSVLVDPPPTAILLQASPSTTPFGSPVTLQASVSALAGPLSGIVQFLDGTILIGSQPMDATGKALLTTSALALGTHTLSARSLATSALAASASPAVLVSITGIQTTTLLTATPNPSYPFQSVTFVASVGSALPSTPATGIVRFSNGNNALADVALDTKSSATLSVSSLVIGNHAILATYLGNTPLVSSQSNILHQVVLDSSFSMAVTPPTLTLQTQHHVTFNLKLASLGSFSGTVNLACGPLPDHATCHIARQVLTLTPGSIQTTTVYLDTSDVIGYANTGPGPLSRQRAPGLLAALFLPLFAGFGWAARQNRLPALCRLFCFAAVFFVLSLGAMGCSSKYPASVAPGSYMLHLTGSSSAAPVPQTAPLQLIVTP